MERTDRRAVGDVLTQARDLRLHCDVPLDDAPTVESAFQLARNADDMELAFDPELGYPVMARIDPMTNTMDEEIDYFVLDLTPSE